MQCAIGVNLKGVAINQHHFAVTAYHKAVLVYVTHDMPVLVNRSKDEAILRAT